MSDERTRYRLDRLDGMVPAFALTVIRLLRAMDALGHPMFITDAGRTTEQQMVLYAKGRTAPGPIVTWVDGVTKRSNHQQAEDGFYHAVDCAFIAEHPWAESHPWALFVGLVRLLGLHSGADFGDRPHVSDRRG